MLLSRLHYCLLLVEFYAVAFPFRPGEPSLDVTLSQTSNTLIKAKITNNGKEDVTFVHLNFFRDTAPVKKADIYQDDTLLHFEGIRQHFRFQGLTPEALTILHAGETLEDEFDIAATTDLSRGGQVTLRSAGSVPLVSKGAVSGFLPYTSNELIIQVDPVQASQVPKAVNILSRRTNVVCTDSQRADTLEQALHNAVSLANAAADAAQSGSRDKFVEYFKTDDSNIRQVVADRLRAVAREADSTNSGATSYQCSDTFGFCQPNVLAYTLPAQNIIANCNIWYTYLPALASGCHNQDQATTAVHEFTHAPGVYSPGTQDLGYGYGAVTALSSDQAVLNADTYALYANVTDGEGLGSLADEQACVIGITKTGRPNFHSEMDGASSGIELASHDEVTQFGLRMEGGIRGDIRMNFVFPRPCDLGSTTIFKHQWRRIVASDKSFCCKGMKF